MEPITVRGNWFWKDTERFFIKGIHYQLHETVDDNDSKGSSIDVLSASSLPNLRKDIKLFRTLGVNTIQISAYDISNEHDKALDLLEKHGFYVILRILNIDEKGPGGKRTRGIFEKDFEPDFNTQRFYTPTLVLKMLHTIAQTLHHANILAYEVDASIVSSPNCSKLAECVRAAVRDAKRLLCHLPGARRIPVGVNIGHGSMLLLQPTYDYFLAGEPAERADFIASENYAWAGSHSSFQVSGWQNLFEGMLSHLPAPMYFATYGAAMYSPRTYEETLREGWAIEHGLVEVLEGGRRRPWHSFWYYRKRLKEVAERRKEEVSTAEVKDFEGWRGLFPTVNQQGGARAWFATDQLPQFPRDWDSVLRGLASSDL
ncbi:glycoside hydrolase family 72 protein [Polychaeton citri CBS 116435]|uniref:1,3-beta-glucanosyltransferase n=1 Tax=Polychaeton citri CBS 116435 TaxID=1314669 RepID=A0A9P4Q6E2_9PEZI|nr:glycoside hydrolase family 72 protein [Polychaeton citri CBS 116435]